MARRRLLDDVQWAGLLSPPSDEREIVRHYTLSDEDLAAAVSKRGDHNRIGFALTLCYLRFPGRALGIGGAHQPDRRLYLGRRGRSGRGCAAVAAGQAIAASSMSCSIIPA